MSVSYPKKDGHARPSFFGYDNNKDLKVCFLVTHVVSVNFTVLVYFFSCTHVSFSLCLPRVADVESQIGIHDFTVFTGCITCRDE